MPIQRNLLVIGLGCMALTTPLTLPLALLTLPVAVLSLIWHLALMLEGTFAAEAGCPTSMNDYLKPGSW